MFSATANDAKATNITPEILSNLKSRDEELQKQKIEYKKLEDEHQRVDAELKAEMEKIQAKRDQLQKALRDKRSKIYDEESSIEKITKISLYASKDKRDRDPIFNTSSEIFIRFRNNLPTGLPSEAKQKLNELSELLVLLSRKFDIEYVRGEINLLDNANIKIYFSHGRYVGREIEGKPALDYFKSLGCNIVDEGWGHLGCDVVTIDHDKCKAAIQGLKLLIDPSASEIENRSHMRSTARC